MDKIYIIDGKEYKLKATTLKDWKEINKLFKALNDVKVSFNNEAEVVFSITSIFNYLIENDLIEKFLEIILIPVKDSADISLITDKVLLDIIKDFFESKKNLMQGISSSFASSLNQKKQPGKNTKA